jgi:hypothetical protein
MAVEVAMVPIDTKVLPVMEPVRTRILSTDQAAMEDWEGQTAMRQQQQKTNETHCLEVLRTGMLSGLPCHQVMGTQAVVTLRDRGRLAKRVDTAHMEKRDSSLPRRKRKKMSQQPNNKSVS